MKSKAATLSQAISSF